MNILIDIGHPAHVHFFRNAIGLWKQHGHRVFITARLKTYVKDLLDYYGLDYFRASKDYRGRLAPLLLTFIVHTINIIRASRDFKPDVILSISSPMAAWASALIGAPHLTFDDTEHASLEHALYLPFTKRVYTPTSFLKDLGRKQKRYPGYHELAYLHPQWFKPNPETLEEFGIQPDEQYFVLRSVSWKASHDIGQTGFLRNEIDDLVRELKSYGKVIISSEARKKTEIEGTNSSIHPAKMHDLLAFATMYIGEGGTMATEASILGTPAIFVSSLTAGNWIELEKKYSLMYSFQHGDEAIRKVKWLLDKPAIKQEWSKKRDLMLRDKIDVTKFMVEEIEAFNT